MDRLPPSDARTALEWWGVVHGAYPSEAAGEDDAFLAIKEAEREAELQAEREAEP